MDGRSLVVCIVSMQRSAVTHSRAPQLKHIMRKGCHRICAATRLYFLPRVLSCASIGAEWRSCDERCIGERQISPRHISRGFDQKSYHASIPSYCILSFSCLSTARGFSGPGAAVMQGSTTPPKDSSTCNRLHTTLGVRLLSLTERQFCFVTTPKLQIISVRRPKQL